MAIHELKTWPVHFRDVIRPNKMLRKMVEIRLDDRGYAVGDTLILKEYQPHHEEYTGAWAEVQVSHILKGSPWLPDGYIAMSIHLLDFDI
ncbi:DUF3850 domain-containing protein [Paenibacillus alkalitolerans]|uniref:DUF3850 domain-containing protein n=1 Tax=Paenibacillus alkalitolerans TaxID=2799335 RepID=UPI0018F6BB4A|nr:DUF3850 domain-containing protein [Paenibacillus alkalitolerans]